MTTRSVRGKLVLKDLGNPDAIKTQPENIRRLVLGRLVGIAEGFVERTDPKTSEKFEGLAGIFRSIPADSSEDELESGVLFIPDAFHTLIASQLRDAQKNDPSARINFAFEVAAIRASNPQGRSWDFKPLWEQQENPIDKLLKLQPMPAAPAAIEDKSGAVASKQMTGGKK